MSKQIEISVIVAVYNVDRFLPECLDSLLQQSFVNAEFVCVDDGSTDASGSILDSYARKDKRFHVMHLPANRGLLNARKTGVMGASGKFLMFLDGDDRLHENALQRADQIMSSGADVAVFSTDFIWMRPDLDRTAYSNYFKIVDEHPVEGEALEVLRSCFVSRRFTWNIWNKIYRNEPVRAGMSAVADVNLVMGEDLYLSFLILSHCQRAIISRERLYVYRVGSGASTIKEMQMREFSRYCDYIVLCQQLGTWVRQQASRPELVECLRAVNATTEGMFRNIFQYRLPAQFRSSALAYMHRVCREAGMLGLMRRIAPISAKEFEIMMAEKDGVAMDAMEKPSCEEEALRRQVIEIVRDEMRPEIELWEKKFIGAQACYDELRNSLSYRVGRAVTFPLRAARFALRKIIRHN